MTKLINEKAVSEVVGVVLLVSVAVLGVAIVAVTFFSQPAPSEIPHLSVVAGATEDNTTFVLVHEGGDALKEGNYRIYVDDGSGLEDRTNAFTLVGDDVWSIGERLTYTGKPERVVISVIDPSGGEMMIAEPAYAGVVDTGGYVDAGGSGIVPVTPGGNMTPDPGSSGNASPIQIVTPNGEESLVFSGNGQGNKYAVMKANVTLEDVTRVDFILYPYDNAHPSDQETLLRDVPKGSDGNYVWDNVPLNLGLKGLTNGDRVVMIAIAYKGTEIVGYRGQVTNVTGAK